MVPWSKAHYGPKRKVGSDRIMENQRREGQRRYRGKARNSGLGPEMGDIQADPEDFHV